MLAFSIYQEILINRKLDNSIHFRAVISLHKRTKVTYNQQIHNKTILHINSKTHTMFIPRDIAHGQSTIIHGSRK